MCSSDLVILFSTMFGSFIIPFYKNKSSLSKQFKIWIKYWKMVSTAYNLSDKLIDLGHVSSFFQYLFLFIYFGRAGS